MKFQYKCFLQKIFSNIPYGIWLNYFMQRYITKSLPQSVDAFRKRWDIVSKHSDIYKKFSNKPIEKSNCYEFGAGWDLMFPLSFSILGFSEIFCVDINPLITAKLINHNIDLIMKESQTNIVKIGGGGGYRRFVSAWNLKNDLEQKFRIHYQAPMDAQKTDIKTSSIDFFYSNNTLEHIPQNIIVPILKECCRILNPEGIFSIRIDYGDHWSYFDKSISKYNYLKFSSKEWNKYNPSLQYQNRLRHSDYLKFFYESGFEIIQENVFRPDQIEIDKLNTLSLAQEFQKYEFDDLTITGCWLIGRKR